MEIVKLKNKITGIKHFTGWVNSRVEMTQDKICKLEDRVIDFPQFKQERK